MRWRETKKGGLKVPIQRSIDRIAPFFQACQGVYRRLVYASYADFVHRILSCFRLTRRVCATLGIGMATRFSSIRLRNDAFFLHKSTNSRF